MRADKKVNRPSSPEKLIWGQSDSGSLISIPLNSSTFQKSAGMSLHNAESIPFSFSRWSDKSLEHSTHVQGIYRNLYEYCPSPLAGEGTAGRCGHALHAIYIDPSLL